jgi:hypothetical protein
MKGGIGEIVRKQAKGVEEIMSDLLPEGEDLRRAIHWISGSLQDRPGQPVHRLVQEATFKFDLSPKDADFLVGFFKERKEER